MPLPRTTASLSLVVLAGLLLLGAGSSAAGDAKRDRCGRITIRSADQQKLLNRGRLKLTIRRCRHTRAVSLRASSATVGERTRRIASADRRLGAPVQRVSLPLTRSGKRSVRKCREQRITVRGVFGTPRRGRARDRARLRLSAGCLPGERPPNVLVILTDDQRVDGSLPVMPNTEREFADGGVQYTNAFATTPLCCPSRASIYSGKYPHNHGIRKNGGLAFDASETWQRYLHDAGYFTGLFGKYFFDVLPTQAPYFDRSATIAGGSPEDGRVEATYAESFLEQAETEDSRPWALVLATNQPHSPWNGTPAAFRPLPPWTEPPSFLEPDLGDKHPAVATEAARFVNRGDDWPVEVRDGQRTELELVDEMVGSVMGNLDRLDERRETLAIFVSDNGYLWGEHGLYHKLWPYLESVRVPMFASWPGRLPEGAVDDRIVANIDIAPTIMQAAGVTPSYTVDGRSLLSGYDRPWLLLEGAIGQAERVPDWTALVDHHQQYIQWGDGFVERYSLDADPYELQASNVPDPELRARLAGAVTCAGAGCP